MPLDQSWEPQNNLTMLGDAAHVMPPFAGEGVNMAMRDAIELSEYLTSNRDKTIHEAINSHAEKSLRSCQRIARKWRIDAS